MNNPQKLNSNMLKHYHSS